MVDYAPSPDPADPAAAAALKGYRAYSEIKVQMYNGAMFTTELLHVAGGKAADDLNLGVTNLQKDNVNYAGRPTSKPTVTSVSGDNATISDCFGGPNWVAVYSAGPNKGKSAEVAGSVDAPHPITATLKQYRGRWYVTDAVTKKETC